MELIGLTGKMGSGKDFTKDYLAEQGYYVARESFADGLRYEIEELLNDGIHLPGIWRKPYPPEVRALLQWWGTDLRRSKDPDYWLKKLDDRLYQYPETGGPLICVTDVRFPNEAEVIKARGGLIVVVWAPTNLRAQRLGLTQDELAERDRHPSERSMDNYPADVILVSEDNQVRPQKGGEVWADLLARTPRKVRA